MRRRFSEKIWLFKRKPFNKYIFICFWVLKYDLIKLAIFFLEVKRKTDIDTNFNAFDLCLMKQKLIS